MAFTVGMPGFSAALLRFPEQKFSVICLSNDNWRLAPWKHALRIADYYLSDQMPDAKPPESAAQKYEYVESAERDLNDKVGAYRMRNTRMVWRVSVLDGKLAVTDHLSATYRWQAIGPQRFRATEGPSKDASTLVFERGAENLFEMRLEGDDGSKIDFESIALVEPNAQRLNDYAGRYYCPELAATYSFSVREGRLFLQVHNRRHERLSPTVADEFMPHLRSSDDGRIITFVRDADRKIVGFKIELWSIKDMTFEKLAEAAN